jgi:integrase
MSLDGQKTTTTSMEWDQFKSLISKLERDGEYKFCLLVAMGVFTGLRISDLLQIKFSQFIDTDFLNIIEKKTKKDRKIKINSDLKEMVERIKLKMNVTNDEQYIFVNKYGTKPIDKSYVNVKLKELFNKYDIHLEGNVSSHLFRKTLGNRALKLNNYSNESMVLLMELFNHSSPSTTKRYLGVRDSEIQSIYDSLKL